MADSGDLASDLGGLFEEVGQAARAHEAGIFLTIDEMHHLPAGRPRGPPARACTGRTGSGLPLVWPAPACRRWPAVSEEARSYAEQMFRFRPLGPLAPDEAARPARAGRRGGGRELEGRRR